MERPHESVDEMVELLMGADFDRRANEFAYRAYLEDSLRQEVAKVADRERDGMDAWYWEVTKDVPAMPEWVRDSDLPGLGDGITVRYLPKPLIREPARITPISEGWYAMFEQGLETDWIDAVLDGQLHDGAGITGELPAIKLNRRVSSYRSAVNTLTLTVPDMLSLRPGYAPEDPLVLPTRTQFRYLMDTGGGVKSFNEGSILVSEDISPELTTYDFDSESWRSMRVPLGAFYSGRVYLMRKIGSTPGRAL